MADLKITADADFGKVVTELSKSAKSVKDLRYLLGQLKEAATDASLNGTRAFKELDDAAKNLQKQIAQTNRLGKDHQSIWDQAGASAAKYAIAIISVDKILSTFSESIKKQLSLNTDLELQINDINKSFSALITVLTKPLTGDTTAGILSNLSNTIDLITVSLNNMANSGGFSALKFLFDATAVGQFSKLLESTSELSKQVGATEQARGIRQAEINFNVFRAIGTTLDELGTEGAIEGHLKLLIALRKEVEHNGVQYQLLTQKIEEFNEALHPKEAEPVDLLGDALELERSRRGDFGIQRRVFDRFGELPKNLPLTGIDETIKKAGFETDVLRERQDRAQEELRKDFVEKQKQDFIDIAQNFTDTIGQGLINRGKGFKDALINAAEAFTAKLISDGILSLLTGEGVGIIGKIGGLLGFAGGVEDLKGAGTSTSDSIPARLSRGESVLTANATDAFQSAFGVGIIDRINKIFSSGARSMQGRYAGGVENIQSAFGGTGGRVVVENKVYLDSVQIAYSLENRGNRLLDRRK